MVAGRDLAATALRWSRTVAEVAVAVGLVAAVLLLVDVAGRPSTEATSTFAVGGLFLWAFAVLGLAVLLGSRGVRPAWRLFEARELPGVRRVAPRLVAEASLALVVTAAALGADLARNGFWLFVGTSAVVALAVLVHHAGSLVLAGWRLVRSG